MAEITSNKQRINNLLNNKGAASQAAPLFRKLSQLCFLRKHFYRNKQKNICGREAYYGIRSQRICCGELRSL